MSMIAVVGVTRSPLTAIASAPASHELLHDGPDVQGGDEVVGLARVVPDRPQRILELKDDPGPGQRDESGRDARLQQLVVERPPTTAAEPWLAPARPLRSACAGPGSAS